MRNLGMMLALWALLLGLALGVVACDRSTPNEIYSLGLSPDKTQTMTVRHFADYHNRHVLRLVTRHQKNGDPLEDFSPHLRELMALDPLLDSRPVNWKKARVLWQTLDRLIRPGTPLDMLHSLLRQGLKSLALEPGIHPALVGELEEAADLLLEKEPQRLLEHLQSMERRWDEQATRREKAVLGVFLGSVERSLQKRYEDPSMPWYWPWVVAHDAIGTIFVNIEFGTMCSSVAELQYVSMFPFWGLPNPW